MKKTKHTVHAILLAMLSSAAIWAQDEMSSHNPLLLGIAVALFFCFRAAFRCREKRAILCSSFLGLLFTLFTVLGKLYTPSEVKNDTVWLLIRFSGFWALFAAILIVLFDKLKDVSLVDPAPGDRSAKKCRQVFFISFLILTAVFSLWWLYEYPGNTSPDSNTQILQALGRSPLSNHHPVAHTMVIKLLFTLGLKLFGGQNAALALYTAFQALFMALCFAYLLESLYEEGVKKSYILAVLALLLLVPYYGSYSITVWKDVPFSGIMLVFAVVLWKLLRQPGDRKPSALRLVLLFFSAFFMCIFRSNGLYAFAATFVFFLFLRGKGRLPLKLVSAAALLSAFLLTGPVYSRLGVVPVDTVESLSIPAQHIARTVADGHELSDEEAALLSRLVDPEELAEAYVPTISDPVKALIRSSGHAELLDTDKSDYLKLWLALGRKYPGAYLRAQIDQTRGYWYPDIKYWTMSNYCEESEQLNIFKDRRSPAWLTAVFDEIGFYLTSIPLAGLLFSIGSAVWLCLVLFVFCFYRKKYTELIVFLPVLALWGTLLIATPVYAEFRYAFPIFTTLPLLCVVPFMPTKKKTEENNG